MSSHTHNLLVLSLGILAIIVSIDASDRVIMETGVVLHSQSEWTEARPALATEELTVYMMMRHEEADVERMKSLFYAVSDPTSSQYGQHLTLGELATLAPIKDSSVRIVREFLGASAQYLDVNPNQDIVSARLTAADAEALFDTKLSLFEHNATGLRLVRAAAPYSVPFAVANAIYLVGDLGALPRPHLKVPLERSVSAWPNSCKLEGCNGLVTPSVLKQRYSVPAQGLSANGTVNNSMAVAEFQGQTFLTSDLKKFGESCNVSDYSVKTIIGGNKPATAGVESELDIEYIKAVSPEIDLTVIYSNEYSLLSWVTSVSNLTSPPLVHSVSYGNDEKQQTGVAYMDSVNVQFLKAGLRGISILFASGDQGVCGREGCGIFHERFKPDFPGGSPYITAVGGTDFLGSDIGEETSWKHSGGGFSDTFDAPAYQKAFVSAYKTGGTKLPDQKYWNATGRGYPDVAALGGQKNPYCVVINGEASGVAGTSASSPTVAAIFARLNGIRLAAGKKPLGFLNPFIYQNGAAFNDVTTGDNKCSCGVFWQEGFEAAKGWDPVTGMGTPNFEKLAAAVGKLP